MIYRFLLSFSALLYILMATTLEPKAATLDAMLVAGRAAPPIGHYEFCKRQPQDCQPSATDTGPMVLTQESWAAVVDVNRRVNKISPMTDLDAYGVEEYWTYPTAVADCEDYVLQKRKLLIELGFTSADLLITVVKQPDGSGHAVLTLRTSIGDYVLDNLRDGIKSWSKTEYFYMKRQDSRDPGKWVKINDDRNTVVGGIN